jgi:hypothetical protein
LEERKSLALPGYNLGTLLSYSVHGGDMFLRNTGNAAEIHMAPSSKVSLSVITNPNESFNIDTATT